MKIEVLRKEYPKFLYNNYKIFEDENKIYIEYEFEIEKLSKFNPRSEERRVGKECL